MTLVIDSPRHPRIAAARQLQRRAGRQEARRFLVEGRQAVSELLKSRDPSHEHEIFATDEACERNADILQGHPVTIVSERVAAALSETVTPQGLVVVAPLLETALDVSGDLRLVVVLVEPRDPGNAGTVIRVADAAGADLVVLVGDSVDPHNGKCVRAAAGSHFHLPIATVGSFAELAESLSRLDITMIGAAGATELTLDALEDSGALAGAVAWVFGNEAHGLSPEDLSLVDQVACIPIYGRAESLNLATAAAVCLYATARAQHRVEKRA